MILDQFRLDGRVALALAEAGTDIVALNRSDTAYWH